MAVRSKFVTFVDVGAALRVAEDEPNCAEHRCGVHCSRHDGHLSCAISEFPAVWLGSAIRKVHPLPGSDSTQIRPPCCSTAFLQIASPMPLPGYSSRVCRRLKIAKISSACSG